MVRASYLAMELTGWCVIVPLCLASFLTGLVQSLGTAWGLFRHYWIVAKLLITIFASVLLLAHMQPIGRMAVVATETTLAAGDFHGLRVQLIADAAAAILVLLVAIALSVYKPQGMTPFGRQWQAALANSDGQTRNAILESRRAKPPTPRWVRVCGIVVFILAVLVVIKHLVGGGFHHMR